MRAATRDWLDGLRGLTARSRLADPLAAASAPAEQAAEGMILGAWACSWLAALESMLAARRAGLAAGPDAREGDPDPAIVIATSPSGVPLIAAGLATAGPSVLERTAVVTEREYRLWCIERPDESRRLHVNAWSWIKKRVPPQRHAEFARHPLGAGESYWLHRAGLAGAGAADRRECHLWKWDGRQATLLESSVAERGVDGLS